MTSEYEKKLQDVNWMNLGAKDMPNWIRLFASEDVTHRKNAYIYFDIFVSKGAESPEDLGKLEEILKTDALVFAVPILIDLLSERKVQRKESILDILDSLAWNIHLSVKDTIEPYQSRANRIFEQIRTGIPLYRYLYNEVDEYGKAVIIELLDIYDSEL